MIQNGASIMLCRGTAGIDESASRGMLRSSMAATRYAAMATHGPDGTVTLAQVPGIAEELRRVFA